MIRLADIEDAAGRIRNDVRRTPIVGVAPARVETQPDLNDLVLKLECLQVTGSFKPRGAFNKLANLAPEQLGRGLVTASGGNHGLAVAYAAKCKGVPATIFLPASVPASKVAKFKDLNARVVIEGQVWDESNHAALAAAEREHLTYVHPFADRDVIAGQGTVGLEMLADAPEIDTAIVAIGGGGLIAGVAAALKAKKPGIKVIGVEPTGAPTLYESVRAGKVIELEAISTQAGTLAPRRSADINVAIIQAQVDEIVLVSDEEMRAASRWLWREMGLATELSGAAAMASLLTGRYKPAAGARVGVVVCGAGTDWLDA
jgi:threonine dehydratase